MDLNLLIALAFVPFILIFFLVVFRRWSAFRAMPLTWAITLAIVLLFWGISPLFAAASFIKGFFVAIEIMLIIFGAVLFLEILREKQQIKNIRNFFSLISNDARIQAIIIAFLFGALIEGIAGFGTPMAVTAPLLVSLGFAPLLAVVLSIVSNSVPVSFGAAGTPVLLGLGGLGFSREFLFEITKTAALFHGIAGLIIPLSLIIFILRHKNKKIISKNLFEILPFMIFAWLSFIIPYFIVAYLVGPELPSIVGGFAGILITCIAAHYKFLVPKNEISFTKKRKGKVSLKSLKALMPYMVIIILLTLSRTIPSLKTHLTSLSLEWENILGSGISYEILPLFTPSFYFFLTAFFCMIFLGANLTETKNSAKRTFSKIKFAAVALIFAIALVQLFLVSGNNPIGIQSMPVILAGFFESLFRDYFVLVSPFIGAFGSFIAGSNTVSNLLFGSFQLETAKSLGTSLVVILSLQVVGGAIGNMIAIHNVLAASATVGLKNQEGIIIRRTIIVMLIYAAIVAVLGFLFIQIL